MGNFTREKNDNRGDFRKRDFGNNRSQMHSAICSRCGKSCEVPFKPTGDKPIFCRDCFRNNKGANEKSSTSINSSRNNFNDKQQYEAVCDNCGAHCKLPFQPTNGKPVYCSNCFESRGNNRERNTGQYNQQLDALNSKLDKIVTMLQHTTITSIGVVTTPTLDKSTQDTKEQQDKDVKSERKTKVSKKITPLKKK